MNSTTNSDVLPVLTTNVPVSLSLILLTKLAPLWSNPVLDVEASGLIITVGII